MGEQGSSWAQFLAYTQQVNPFAPAALVPFLAIAVTALESMLALLLLIGYQTRRASCGAAGLALTFALAMTYSLGVKETFDYSGWVAGAAALLLATLPAYRWSLDEYFARHAPHQAQPQPL